MALVFILYATHFRMNWTHIFTWLLWQEISFLVFDLTMMEKSQIIFSWYRTRILQIEWPMSYRYTTETTLSLTRDWTWRVLLTVILTLPGGTVAALPPGRVKGPHTDLWPNESGLSVRLTHLMPSSTSMLCLTVNMEQVTHYSILFIQPTLKL